VTPAAGFRKGQALSWVQGKALAFSEAGVAAGMALGVAAYFLFSGHDAAIKWLVTGAPGEPALFVWQVLAARSLFIVVSVVLIGRRRVLERAILTPEKPKLLIRSAIILAAWLSYYSAARDLPLAQLLTLYFAAPIITTVLAMPMLGERVPAGRWVSVGVGFCGVVVACDPGGLSFSWAAARVLMAAAFWGVAVILMRQIARRETTLVQMLYANGGFLIATGVMCAARFVVPDARQMGLLCLVAVAGAVGQFCLFEGARRAPASVMASVEYTALIWAFVLGWVVFADIPRLPVFVGAALILLAGAWLVASEHRRARQVNTLP
jgi:drug/metabolite transporter (DMT)-like permease